MAETRVYKNLTRHPFETEYGTIEICPNGPDTVYVSGEDGIVVSNVEYRFSCHLGCEAGQWRVNVGAFSLQRKTYGTWKGSEPTPGAMKKVREMVVKVMTEWAQTHKKELWVGIAENLNNQIVRVDDELLDLEKKMAQSALRRAELLQQEAEALCRMEECA